MRIIPASLFPSSLFLVNTQRRRNVFGAAVKISIKQTRGLTARTRGNLRETIRHEWKREYSAVRKAAICDRHFAVFYHTFSWPAHTHGQL